VILTRTPLRISLAGGGTDVPAFFQNNGFGAVVSFTIDKYIYVSVNPKFDGRTRVSYSETETVDHYSQLKHDIAREMLRYFDVYSVEITSVADIPGGGTGLGSSSAYAVGLGMALRRFTGIEDASYPSVPADLAYRVERERCGHPVGMQDHYAAAYGGLRYYEFNGGVSISGPVKTETCRALERQLLLFYTGKTRSANGILKEQESTLATSKAGPALRTVAQEMRDNLLKGNVHNVGRLLNASWHIKKTMATGISNAEIDELYERAMGAGADGGKICGAGGGGFLLFAAHPDRHEGIEQALKLRRVPFKIEPEGSKVVYQG
jgi:D-glycero-alpha-D-manno-heptose-7-phosphate kinase